MIAGFTAALVAAACGGASTAPLGGAAQSAAITVEPSVVQTAPATTLNFAVQVTGIASTQVIWSVREGSSGGTITAGGSYTAPTAAGTYHVIATSAADSALSGISTVSVTATPAVAVTLTPSTVSLATGATTTFRAIVSGTSDTSVVWTVQEGASGGSVTSSGVYTAPSTAGTYHVVATSNADPTTKASSLVTVTAPGSLVYPPDVTFAIVPMPALSIPAYLTPVTDPTFGTTIERIGTSPFNGSYPYHHYSKDQAWNSDGTLIKLAEGAQMAILDGKAYAHLRDISAPDHESVWSNTDPNKIYATNGNSFISMDTYGNRTTLHTFSEYTDVSIGNSEGNLSNDDRYTCLVGVRSDGTYDIVSYDVLNLTKVAVMNTSTNIDNCAASQSGKYMFVAWAHGRNNYSYSINFTNPVLLAVGTPHMDVCYDTSGNEVAVAENNAYYRLDTGAVTTLIPGASTNWSHVSCRNVLRPGWAYISPMGESGYESNSNWQRLMAVKLDGSGVVENFAHAHHEDTVNVYLGSPMIVPNRTGDVVMWKVAWDGSGSVYSYVAHQ